MANLLTNEALWGAIVGGLFAFLGSIGAQLVINSRQKKLRQREELLPVASRALQTAQQSWRSLRGHAAIYAPGTPEIDHELAEDYLARYSEASENLELALEELSLLVPNIDAENERLIKALKLGVLRPGRQHDKQESEYRAARTALQRKLRRFLGTDRSKL